MTPTQRMQEIEASRQRLLKNQTSKLSRMLINEVADEAHESEMIRIGKPTPVGDIAKTLLQTIQENAKKNDNRKQNTQCSYRAFRTDKRRIERHLRSERTNA